ncbi:hypothetical protein PTKIN_Ptkin09bG0028600 [Pterospermum kingtungense]
MRAGFCILILLVSLSLLGICNADGLSYTFYRKSCPRVDKIVKRIIQKRANPALGARLIRMQFHDCFVRGCDGSVLLDSVGNSTAEKQAIPNQSLSGFDVIDEIKDEVEKACPKVVSCSDILALAAREAVPNKRRLLWDVQLGRRDGRVSLASEINGNIPGPFGNFSTLLQIFQKKRLNIADLVVLSGAHTIGVSHCGAFSRRLYNFTGKGDADPSLDEAYASILRKQCPNPASPNTTVAMDPGSSLSFDKHYYDILRQKKGLFVSDAALLTDRSSNRIVFNLQRRPDMFYRAFAQSMKKMAAIEVLTGTNGEIRQNCRVVNP